MNKCGIKICPTYIKVVLCDDTESPSGKSMYRDAIKLNPPIESPLRKLFMNFHFVYQFNG